MFFLLSKTLNYLTMPLTIICLCVVISFFIRNDKWKRRFLWTGIILLLFFSNDFIANEIMRGWEVKAKPFLEMRHYKLGIVLTGSTTTHQPNDRVYFHRGADRVTHTVQLYKEGFIEKILISGGSGRIVEKEEPEANKFKEAMLLMGVPENVILIENETRNTAESAIEVRKMLDTLHYQSSDCLLITSAFHMRRSLACYRKAGLEIEPFSTDFYAHERDFYPDSFLIPRLEALTIWHKLTKEWVGFIAYKMAGYI